MKKLSAGTMALVALFAAMTALGAYLRIPVPYVPITFQFFFSALAGILLGSRMGALSQAVYVAVGLAGAPIFTQGGGISYVLKPTFGYLLGFILCAWVAGRLTERSRRETVTVLFRNALAGMLVMYAAGVPYLYLVYNLYLGDPKSVGWVLYWGLVTCVGGDILSAGLAAMLSSRLLPILRRTGLALPRQGAGSELDPTDHDRSKRSGKS